MTEDLPTLIKPCPELEASYCEMVDAYLASRPEGAMPYVMRPVGDDFSAYVRELQDRENGVGLPKGYVPQSTYWLVRDGSVVVGESRLRHRLTPALLVEGGHIGYMIHPRFQRRGYGTLILKLTLEKARERGIERARVTCDTDNIGSTRVILANGGKTDGEEGISPWDGKPIRNYWIEL